METNDVTEQDRRGFLQVAGAAATLTLGGLPSAARSTSEATGKLKIEKVGLMSPGDMGQAVAIQIKAKGLNVYTALEHRSERTRGLAREAGILSSAAGGRFGGSPNWVCVVAAAVLVGHINAVAVCALS